MNHYRGALQLAEPVLEQVEHAIEVGAQAADGGRPVLAGERPPARGTEELPVDADEQSGRDPRVALLDAELLLDRVGEHLDEMPHHLELLRPQGGRRLDDPREGGEARARQTLARRDLETTQPREYRLAWPAIADCGDERRLARGHLVEEEVFLGRKVVVDGFLG